MKTIVIVGTARYINDLDLHKLEGIETIGCNRILMHPYFRPTHLFIADRRPYIPELASGRLKEWSEKLNIWLSRSLWDKKIKCGGTPVQRKPRFRHKEFRGIGTKNPFNWKTFDQGINSFGNTGISLLQAAVILGATRIGMLGIGLVKPNPEPHFYAEHDASLEDDWGRMVSPQRTYDLTVKAKKALKKMKIEVRNLSLENEALEEIYAPYPFDLFIERTEK